MKSCLISNTALYITNLNVAEFDFLLPSFQNANAFRVVPTIPSMQADQNRCHAFHRCKLMKPDAALSIDKNCSKPAVAYLIPKFCH